MMFRLLCKNIENERFIENVVNNRLIVTICLLNTVGLGILIPPTWIVCWKSWRPKESLRNQQMIHRNIKSTPGLCDINIYNGYNDLV